MKILPSPLGISDDREKFEEESKKHPYCLYPGPMKTFWCGVLSYTCVNTYTHAHTQG